MLSRRGFLGTLAAAATGAAAAFDPIAKLWVPKALASDLTAERALEHLEIISRPLSSRAVQAVIDTQLELNDLALRVARAMTDRLAAHKSVLLRQVVYELSGQTHLDGLIRMPAPVEKLGPQGSAEFLEKVYPGISSIPEAVGQFEPSQHRVMALQTARSSFSQVYVDTLANELREKVWGFDMFVPITGELRPGEPFSDDVAIGVATDPESGLTVRVLRFDQEQRGGNRPFIGAEMVGGEWEPQRPRRKAARRIYDDYGDLIEED